jgi:hypothetical protein
MMPYDMRTTVTLDPDVERLLRDAMHRQRVSFKEALNQAIRTGLAGAHPARETRFKTRARPMGLRAGMDAARLNQIGDDLEADGFLALTARLETERRAKAARRK